MPKISIIIPVYNSEKYLNQCLDSIFNQTLKDIEVICVDDGSTDSSLEIIRKMKDERIKIFQQKNLGAGIARNVGIKEAQGEYIIFCDSDDFYINNNILEILYSNASKNNANICGGTFSHTDGVNIKVGSTGKSFEGYSIEQNGFIDFNDWQYDYGFHRFIYNTEFLRKNKLKFPSYKRFQDPPFLVKAMYKSRKFYGIKDVTYTLRAGHVISWNDEKIMDLFSGISDNLVFSKRHKLSRLHYLTVIRLKQHMKKIKIENMSLRAKIKLFETILKTDTSTIRKFEKNYNKFVFLKSFYKKDDAVLKLIYKVIGNKKVVLWGASNFITKILELEKSPRANILGIIDRNPEMRGKKCGNYEIFSPKDIVKLMPDAVFFSIINNNEVIYNSLKQELGEKHPEVELLPNIFDEGLIFNE